MGHTFANFYMWHLENSEFDENPMLKPTIYCICVDDIFIATNNFDVIIKLKDKFIKKCILKFSFELEICKQLPLLDTIFPRTNHNITTTSIFIKLTITDECLNYNGVCPIFTTTSQRLKAFPEQNYAICSSSELLHDELQRIKQVPINNNFPNYIIDKQITKFLNEKIKSNNLNNDVR